MTNFEKVGIFMKTFGQEVKTKAELSNDKINELRISLINEELEELKKDYEMLGYNTEMINGYKHKLYTYPLYLAIMVCIGSILMLNIKHNKSKVVNITLGITISVIIYYINYFFNVIIETKDVPYLTSIWGPQIILSLIIITNLIRINEK